MKPNNLNRFWLMFIILALAALACSGGQAPVEPVATAQPITEPAATSDGSLSQSERTKLISATVQIFGLFSSNGELVPGYTGSGTILTPSGMILTNAHVASPAAQGDPDNEPDALGVAIVESEDRPPVVSYYAEVLVVDGFLDLAVIQITSTIDGGNIDTASLSLPHIELGDSTQTHVGDHINIFGFPGIGGETITFTDGSVSGFTSEDQIGDRAWIKTDATIAGGNSGGLAANDNAEIIGVPTIAASGAEGNITDCRVVQDTNGDGQLTKEDTCIPIGGFINGLRPINLAEPLIQAAQAGKQYTSPFRLPGVVGEDGSGQEALSGFVWLSADADCNFGDVIESYSAGALCIAPGFEYAGMTNGEQFRELWMRNGENVGEFTYSWEWDADGRFVTFLQNNGDPLPEGTYRVEFFAGANLQKIGESPEVAVGNASGGASAPTQPSEDVVTLYGVVTDADTGKPVPGVYVFMLSPGITYEKWQAENWSDKYVEASLQTDDNGKYEITGIPRNTQFTVVFSTEGYYDKYGDNLEFGADDPNPFEMNVEMSK